MVRPNKPPHHAQNTNLLVLDRLWRSALNERTVIWIRRVLIVPFAIITYRSIQIQSLTAPIVLGITTLGFFWFAVSALTEAKTRIRALALFVLSAASAILLLDNVLWRASSGGQDASGELYRSGCYLAAFGALFLFGTLCYERIQRK